MRPPHASHSERPFEPARSGHHNSQCRQRNNGGGPHPAPWWPGPASDAFYAWLRRL